MTPATSTAKSTSPEKTKKQSAAKETDKTPSSDQPDQTNKQISKSNQPNPIDKNQHQRQESFDPNNKLLNTASIAQTPCFAETPNTTDQFKGYKIHDKGEVSNSL